MIALELVLFGWLKRKVSDFRFERAFKHAEQEALRGSLAEAERRFDTSQFEAQVELLCKSIEAEADAKFSIALRTVRDEIAQSAAGLQTRERQLRLLKRNYSDELAKLYDISKGFTEKIERVYEEKAEAVDQRECAQASIEAWYAKSKGRVLGNRGKALPSHSLFGQSFSDLERHKSDRAQASELIRCCAKEINELKAKRREVGTKIGRVKRCRTEWQALRENGVTQNQLDAEIVAFRARAASLSFEETKLVAGRARFVDDSQRRQGVFDLESTMAGLKRQKTAFMAAFVTRRAHLRRRVVFRRLWEEAEGK